MQAEKSDAPPLLFPFTLSADCHLLNALIGNGCASLCTPFNSSLKH